MICISFPVTLLHKPLCVAAAGDLGLPALCKAGQQTTQCVTDKPTRIGVDIAVALAAVYFIATYMLLWLKLRWFKKMPYAAVKKGIVYFTLQVWYLYLCVNVIMLMCSHLATEHRGYIWIHLYSLTSHKNVFGLTTCCALLAGLDCVSCVQSLGLQQCIKVQSYGNKTQLLHLSSCC